MSRTLVQKKDICSQIEDILNNYKGFIFLKHSTITGDEFSEFRKLIKSMDGVVVCVKKSLLKRAMNDNSKVLADQDGSLMLVASNDFLKINNILPKIKKKIIGLEVHNSLIENQVVQVDDLEKLSPYSSLKDLKAMVITLMRINHLKLTDILSKIIEKTTTQDSDQ